MREQFKQWRSKMRSNQRWVVGAIATPVLLWTMWWFGLLPNNRLQPNYGRLSNDESATAPTHRKSPITGIGAIATVAGGAFLLVNCRRANKNTKTATCYGANLSEADLRGANLRGADLRGAGLYCADLNGANLRDVDFSGADLRGANLCGADFCGANLSRANLSGTDLRGASLNGTNLCETDLRYADLSDASLRFANLSDADLRFANLSGADLNCAFLSRANLGDANLSGALLFLINLRDVRNLEPFQLQAKPWPFLCNVALPSYSRQPDVDPNRDSDRIPQLLSDRYHTFT